MSTAAKHRKRAVEFEQLKQIDRAIASYVRAIEESEAAGEDVDVALLNKVGDLALRQGRVPDAIIYYERAVEHYTGAGLINNAIALCNKILRNAPGRGSVYLTLGRICTLKGLRGDATRNFLEYATRMRQEGRTDEAMRTLAEIVGINPDLAEVGGLVEAWAAQTGIVLPRRPVAEAPDATSKGLVGSDYGTITREPGSSDLIFLEVDYGDPKLRTPIMATRVPTPSASAQRVDSNKPAAEEAGVGALPFLDTSWPDEGLADFAASTPGVSDTVEAGSLPLQPQPSAEISSESEDIPTVAMDGLEVIVPEFVAEVVPLTECQSPIDGLLPPSFAVEPESVDVNEVSVGAALVTLSQEPLLTAEEEVPVISILMPNEVESDVVDLFGEVAYKALAQVTPECSLNMMDGNGGPSREPLYELKSRTPHDGACETASETPLHESFSGVSTWNGLGSPSETPGDDLVFLDVDSAPLEPPDGGTIEPAASTGESLEPLESGVGDGLPMETEVSDGLLSTYGRPGPDEPGLILPVPSYGAGDVGGVCGTEACALEIVREGDERSFHLDSRDFVQLGELPPLLLADALVDQGIAMAVALEQQEPADLTVELMEASDGIIASHQTPLVWFGAEDDGGRPVDSISHGSAEIEEAWELLDLDAIEQPDALHGGVEESIGEPPEPGAPVCLSGKIELVSGKAQRQPSELTGTGVGDEAITPEEPARDTGEPAQSRTPVAAAFVSVPTAAVAAEATVAAAARRDNMRAAVARLPHDWLLRRRLAEALFEAGEREAALHELETAQQGLVNDGEIQSAAEVVDELVRVAPDHVVYHQKRVELAVRLKDRDRLQLAYLDLADALVYLGEESRAHAVYARVLELDPWDDRARAALGAYAPPPPPTPPPLPSASAAGDSFVDLGELVRDDRQPSTRMRMQAPAISGDEQADFDTLLQHFKAGVSRVLAEDDFEGYYDLGVAYKEMGLLDDAVGEFQKALRSRAHRLPAYEALGQCFVEQERYQIAATVLSRALYEPGLDDEKRIGVLYLLGHSCEALQRRVEARGYFQRVYVTDSHFRDVAARLAALDQAGQ